MPVGEVRILADPHRDLDPTESHLVDLDEVTPG